LWVLVDAWRLCTALQAKAAKVRWALVGWRGVMKWDSLAFLTNQLRRSART
jgi:hypothetical protein